MLLAREHLKRVFLLDQLTLKYSYPKNPPKIVKIVLSHMHIRQTDYPTGTDPESGSRSQVGTGIEPILKFQDPESYRNRGFWNRSNTSGYVWGMRGCVLVCAGLRVLGT